MEEIRLAPTIFQPRDKDKEVPVLYCNAVRMGMTVWDISMDIGQAASTEVVQPGPGQPAMVPVDYKVRIVMSPQHAKALAQLLLQNVQQYENLFGEVQIQPKEHKKE